MGTWRFCVEFTVPDEIDIEEWPPKGEFFTSDPVPNLIMEKVGAAVGADTRWTLKRVASVHRAGPTHPGAAGSAQVNDVPRRRTLRLGEDRKGG